MGLRFSSATTSNSNNEMNLQGLQFLNLKNYNFTELKEATANFSPANHHLGHGFKGFIHGQPVFLEFIHPKNHNPTSLENMVKVHQLGHPTIMKMIGFCLKDDKSVLVYEFVSRSFQDYLHGSGRFQPVTWSVCMKIARGVAEGLQFLHYEAELLYEHFKISDVLLDLECNAKLRYFGLIKEELETETLIHPGVLDISKCSGYTAPEFNHPGLLRFSTRKTNVYGFGMLLLEILSGEEVVRIQRNNSGWARSFVSAHRSCHVVIARSQEHFKNDVTKVSELAYECVSDDPGLRPDMNHVVQVLEQLH